MSADGSALLRLAEEVDELGRRLNLVGVELRALQGASAPTQVPATPMPPIPIAAPMPVGAMNIPPMAAMSAPPPFAPQSPGALPPYGMRPYAPPPQRRTLGDVLGQEGAGSRVLAWVGGAVTLLGMVLLLVLAVQRGWLGPLPRVLVGAAFGAGLVAVGLWLHRTPTGRTGAFALAATGIAVLYLDAIAATTLYGFLPTLVGLAAGLVIAVGGLLLATRWDSAVLGAAVVVGCAVCAPMITKGFTPVLVTFLLVVQAATTPVQLRRDWTPVALGAGIPPLLASVLSTITVLESTGRRHVLPDTAANTAAAIGAGVVGVVLALVAARRRSDSPAALILIGAAAAPALIAALSVPRTSAALLASGAAVVLLGTWAGTYRWSGMAGTIAGVAGMVALLQATVTVFDGSARSAALLCEAVVLALAAWQIRHRVVLGAGVGFAVTGTVSALATDLPPTLLIEFRPHRLADLVGSCMAAALILAVSVALPWAASRVGATDRGRWLVAGGFGLYGAAGMVLSLAMMAIAGRAGFLTGHVLITVSWTVAALVLLVRGIDVVALRVTGLVLVGAAVVNLVLFDLSTLDGIARVAVFLCAGLVLLAAGSRYARLVGSREQAGGEGS